MKFLKKSNSSFFLEKIFLVFASFEFFQKLEITGKRCSSFVIPEFDSLFQVSFLSENWKKLKVVRVSLTDWNKRCLGNCSFFQFQYLRKYCKLKDVVNEDNEDASLHHNWDCYNLQIQFTLTKRTLFYSSQLWLMTK